MPTIRRVQAEFLFVRDDWPQSWKERAIRLKLTSRELFQPGGLNAAERDVLRRIASGDQDAVALVGPGELDAEAAKRSLTWPWLQG